MASDAVGIGDILVGVELVECGPFTVQDGDKLVLEGNSQGVHLSVLKEERVPCADGLIDRVHAGCGGRFVDVSHADTAPAIRIFVCTTCGHILKDQQ